MKTELSLLKKERDYFLKEY